MVGYHWTSIPTCLKWGLQGKIMEAEMDTLTDVRECFRLLKSDHCYSAEDAHECAGSRARFVYGEWPFVEQLLRAMCCMRDNPCWHPHFRLKAGYWIIWHTVIEWHHQGWSNEGLSAPLSRQQLLLQVYLGKLVPFIDFVNTGKNLFVLHHHILTGEVLGGPRLNASDAYRQPINWEFIDKPRTFYNFVYNQLLTQSYRSSFNDTETALLLEESLLWLRRFFGLLAYQDGFSLIRSISIAPEDPWSTFDPEVPPTDQGWSVV